MSAFTGELVLVHPDRTCPTWRLAAPFAYEVGRLGSGAVVAVPIGAETDGSSIPRLLWPIEPPLGRAVRAAIIHDHLYARLRRGEPHRLAPCRARADAIFREALIVAGVSRPLAWIMWAAVRGFGSRHART